MRQIILSLTLLLAGVLVIVIMSSLATTALSALILTISGSELPTWSELANRTMETEGWALVTEVLRGLACLGLVALIVVYFDKQKFQFQALGIAWKPNPIFMTLAGCLFMSLLFWGAQAVASIRGIESDSVSDALRRSGISRLLILYISALANAFWQELIFRGYWQPRLQRSHGTLPGILISSLVFVALHGLVQSVSISGAITGVILFLLVGWLYYASNSIALATAVHATGNFYIRLFDEIGATLPPHLDRSVVYVIGLVAAFLVFKDQSWSAKGEQRTS